MLMSIPGLFPCLEAKLVFKRRVGIYLVNTYIPSILSVRLISKVNYSIRSSKSDKFVHV